LTVNAIPESTYWATYANVASVKNKCKSDCE
jgi:hypothetical protein